MKLFRNASFLFISIIACSIYTNAQSFPTVTKFVEPAFPPAAQAVRAEGSVVVALEVNKDGKVDAAHPESGHPLLRQAAVNAARQWEFAPLLGNHFISLTFVFKINTDRKARPSERLGAYKLQVSAPMAIVEFIRVH
ncbi:MAG: energy transducer TonB [Acidobacteriota bacterium]